MNPPRGCRKRAAHQPRALHACRCRVKPRGSSLPQVLAEIRGKCATSTRYQPAQRETKPAQTSAALTVLPNRHQPHTVPRSAVRPKGTYSRVQLTFLRLAVLRTAFFSFIEFSF
ncbi:hypothetical protein MRX96_058514 [Rhipicephalus microplus]